MALDIFHPLKSLFFPSLVHHKSVEQVERLKSRVQMHYVKKKSNSSDGLKTAVVRKTSTLSRPSNAFEDKIKSQLTVPVSCSNTTNIFSAGIIIAKKIRSIFMNEQK